MKKVLLLGLVTLFVATSGGCYTPAYTPDERSAQINRNADYKGKQMIDDFDSVFLLRPSTHLTIWDLR